MYKQKFKVSSKLMYLILLEKFEFWCQLFHHYTLKTNKTLLDDFMRTNAKIPENVSITVKMFFQNSNFNIFGILLTKHIKWRMCGTCDETQHYLKGCLNLFANYVLKNSILRIYVMLKILEWIILEIWNNSTEIM